MKNITLNDQRSSAKNVFYTACVALVFSALLACGNEPQQAAPAGDHAVLEQLANAYRKVSEQYPVQPQAMPPEGRRKFLDQVFAQAGYNYSATLFASANPTTVTAGKDRHDLMDLLLLPTKGLSDEALAKLYPADELVAVQTIRKAFR